MMTSTLWQTLQNLPVTMSQFHFLRPSWLIALIPILLLIWWYLRQMRHLRPPIDEKQKQWAGHVDAHLLPYLIIGQADSQLESDDEVNNKSSKSKGWLLTLSLLLCSVAGVLAIAGPTWQQKPVPAVAGNTPIMIVLSLAQSMNADDVKPNRLQRAIHKVRDILAETEGDQRGFVIYSDMAFTAAPLTNDSQVIQQMLPELSTNLMPVLGNRLDLAIDKATELLQRGGAIQGNIIILTDGIGDEPDSSLQAAERAKQLGYKVSVLGVGTQSGGLLTLGDGRRVTDNSGQTVTTALDVDALASLATDGGGRFEVITASNQDVKSVLNNAQSQGGRFDINNTTESEANDWVDMGFWLLFIPIILMPFAFKRGTFVQNGSGQSGGNIRGKGNMRKKGRPNTLMAIAPVLIIPTFVAQWLIYGVLAFGVLSSPYTAYADTAKSNDASNAQQMAERSMLSRVWNGLWQTTRQQAQTAFDNGYFQQAAQLFSEVKASDSTISWQASSEYKAGNYQQSAKLFNQMKQDYNLGNALAKSGDLQGALEAYERHLKSYPKDEDAIFNRDLVKKLLEEQKQQQDQDENKQDNKQESNDDQKADQNQQGDQNPDNQDPDSQDPNNNDEASQDQNQNQNQGDQKDDQQQNDEQQSDEQRSADESKDESQQDVEEQQADAEGNDDDNASEGSKPMFQPQPLDQATEQALRRVPDDSSGLLRARIMQYYERQYLQQQQQ